MKDPYRRARSEFGQLANLRAAMRLGANRKAFQLLPNLIVSPQSRVVIAAARLVSTFRLRNDAIKMALLKAMETVHKEIEDSPSQSLLLNRYRAIANALAIFAPDRLIIEIFRTGMCHRHPALVHLTLNAIERNKKLSCSSVSHIKEVIAATVSKGHWESYYNAGKGLISMDDERILRDCAMLLRIVGTRGLSILLNELVEPLNNSYAAKIWNCFSLAISADSISAPIKAKILRRAKAHVTHRDAQLRKAACVFLAEKGDAFCD